MPKKLEGKIALVTGGTTGIGLATAKRFVAEGAKVVITGRRKEVLDAAAERGVNVTVVQLDVTNPESVERAVEGVVESAGGIFGLVNNAGIGLRGCFEDLQMSEIRAVYEANVFGTMNVTRRVLPYMREARRGRMSISPAASPPFSPSSGRCGGGSRRSSRQRSPISPAILPSRQRRSS